MVITNVKQLAVAAAAIGQALTQASAQSQAHAAQAAAQAKTAKLCPVSPGVSLRCWRPAWPLVSSALTR